MKSNQIQGIFFDKRDSQYFKLRSPVQFFEIFTKKKTKSSIDIPQTIIFNKGNPRLWLFNSKNKDVLKKNSDKLNLTEVARILCGVRNTVEFRIDSLTTLQEVVKHLDPNERVAFIRFQGELRNSATRLELVKMFLESKDKMVQTIQSFVPTHSRGTEVYYVEYRNDDNNLPVSYRYFKKSTTTKPVEVIKKNMNGVDSSPFQDLLDPLKATPVITESRTEQVVQMYKNVDQRLNDKLQGVFRAMVIFLEKAYRVRVKKVVGKFMLDGAQNPYFMGLKELYIDIVSTAPYDIQQFKLDLQDSSNCTFESFSMLCKLYLQRLGGKKQFKIPETIYEDDKEISAKLFRNLIVEKCSGDFCDYIMVEKNRGPLAIRKNVLDDYKKHFGEKKVQEEIFSINLPHEISFQLVLRTRDCALEVIDLLRKNKIFSKLSNHHYTNEEYVQEFDTNKEYPFSIRSTKVFNVGNLYKNVKICRNCFIVYSLTTKYFDSRLKKDLKTRQWKGREEPQSTQKDKRQTSSLAQLPKLPPSSSQIILLVDTSTQLENNKRGNTASQTPLDEKQIQPLDLFQNNQALAKSASSQDPKRFRIMRRTEPKEYKLFMPVPSVSESGLVPKSRQNRAQTQKNPTSQTRRQMELIRIAMGFLNYEDRGEREVDSAAQTQSRMQQQIQLYNKGVLVRKPLQLQESKVLQDFHAEKIQMRKRCLNEMDMRIKLKEYLYKNVSIDAHELLYIGPTAIYSYHTNFQHLRQLTQDRISTPLQAILDVKSVSLLKDIDIRGVCRIAQTPYPPMSIPDDLISKVQFLLFDSVTTIPYLVLQSEGNQYFKQEQGVYTQGNNQVILFAGDMFDSAFEYLQVFNEIITQIQNTTIILMNLPGQAYSVFDDSKTYDNLLLCELVDRLIFELDDKNIIQSSSDTFKFIGVGYGGFVFQTYLCFAVDNIPFIQSILLINSFAEVDAMLKDTLVKSAVVFATCPTDMQELAYNYYSVIANSRQLEDLETRNKMSYNPISLEGRQCIIASILASQSVAQQFTQLPVEVSIVHTLKNCIVSLSQTDVLQKTQDDMYKDSREKLTIKRRSRTSMQRFLQLVDGGHSLIEENSNVLWQLFMDFMKADQLEGDI